MLFEGVKTENMEVNWNKSAHFGLVFPQKHTQFVWQLKRSIFSKIYGI
jgi:hypothetical protein